MVSSSIKVAKIHVFSILHITSRYKYATLKKRGTIDFAPNISVAKCRLFVNPRNFGIQFNKGIVPLQQEIYRPANRYTNYEQNTVSGHSNGRPCDECL